MRHKLTVGLACTILFCITAMAQGALYRVVPANAGAVPGSAVNLTVEVETQAADNLVGYGHFGFGIDLLIGGTAGATAGHVTSVAINTAVFDDVASGSIGSANGAVYENVAGASMDAFGPNPGAVAGDIVELFAFQILVPASALEAQYIDVSLREGTALNVTVNEFFDPVSPQLYDGVRIAVIPEPGTIGLLLAAMAWCGRGVWRRAPRA